MTQSCLTHFCTVGVVAVALSFSSVLAAGPTAGSASAPLTEQAIGQAPAGHAVPSNSSDTHSSVMAQQKQTWNLQNADIRAVIHTMSQLTGKNFVIDPRVQGRVTIVSKTPMTVDQLYKVFLSMLQVLGYAAVPSGDVVKIIPAMNAKEYAGTRVVTGKSPKNSDQVVMKVVPVYNVSAAQLVPILRPLMHQWGSIMAYTPSNTLILAGSAGNVDRLQKIVHDMDAHNASEIQEVELKNATAQKLVKVLDKLQQDNRAEGKVTNVSFAADTESNSILISGSLVSIRAAKRLIHQLDIKAARDGGGLRVVHLKFLRATRLVPVLVRLIGGKTENMAGSAGVPSAADENNTSGIGSGNSSVPTSTGQPSSPSPSPLSGLVAGGTNKIAIVAESSNNSILISAPAQTINKLTKVIHDLDVRPMQVLVEAIIVRINESLLRKLGIQWGTFGVDPSPASQGNDTTQDGSGGISNANIGFHVGTGFLRDSTIKGLLTAIQNNTNSQILATPSIVVLNNQKAVISDGVNVGLQNRSYATSDTGANLANEGSSVPFTTTQRTDVTLKLEVTPQISPNSTVMLKINQSDRELDPNSESTNPENPLIATSLINTNVLVNSKDILVLGGLIRNDHSIVESKIPILGDIPLFGKLFTYQVKKADQKNLMVFLKPVILHDKWSNRGATSKRYNYMRGEQLKSATGQTLIKDLGEDVLPRMHGTGHAMRLPPPFPAA